MKKCASELSDIEALARPPGPPWKSLLKLRQPSGCFPIVTASYFLDCLTLWVSNLCLEGRNVDPENLQSNFLRRVDELINALGSFPSIVVSNEVGNGIVPDSELGRTF
jgi:adenosylcobinamide kinase/adenosylcobinamide-phosphate guanylyltransferase